LKKKKQTKKLTNRVSSLQKPLSFIKRLTAKTHSLFTKLYYREEEPEYLVPSQWRKDSSNPSSPVPTPQSPVKQTKFTLPSSTPKIRRTRIHVPLLRPLKKTIAIILFFINGLVGLVTLSSSFSILSLIFLGNAFILLDYLYKTSKWKLVKEVEE